MFHFSTRGCPEPRDRGSYMGLSFSWDPHFYLVLFQADAGLLDICRATVTAHPPQQPQRISHNQAPLSCLCSTSSVSSSLTWDS